MCQLWQFQASFVHPMTFRRRRAAVCISQVSRRRETCRTRLQRGINFSKKASLVSPADSHNVVVEQPVVEPTEKTPDKMRVSSEEESAGLPCVADGSKRPHTSKPTGKHNVFTHVPNNPDCEFARSLKLPGLHAGIARKREETPSTGHKALNEEKESRLQHRHAVVVQDFLFCGFKAPQRRPCTLSRALVQHFHGSRSD